MTDTAQSNGTAPAAPEDDAAPAGASASERMLGIFGMIFAAGLLLIGLDLVTGGSLSRMVTTRGGGTEDESGNPGAE